MLRVEVSPSVINRALHIMDALLVACEERGWPIHVERHQYFGQPIARGGVWPVPKPDARNVSTIITVNRQPVEVALVERFAKRPPTIAETRQYKKSWPYGILNEVTAPTGELTLSVVSYGSHVRNRKVFDTPAMKVEAQLNRFVVTLVETAISLRRERVHLAIRGRDERRSERKRAAAERVKQRELRRVKMFEDAVSDWRRERLQTAFLRALRRRVAERSIAESALTEWLAWAETHVQQQAIVRLMDRIRAEGLEND
jgi:hypothetical protein